MKLIGIKYCGGCNPVMDRAKLVREIKRRLPPEYIVTEDPTKEQWDIGILICGCLTACADKPDSKNSAGQWIIAAGNSVDRVNAHEKKLAEMIIEKITDMSAKANF
ncbi:MAG: hypothetical protein CVU55_10400 [Deltaproteobacteria bacterium HGW-Deltaproteobacteria-13]|nr:MAG: hypothetical protein CVU55_10400 [Deltaproteobacteria bacterium HGW-Deltaproteobacteria-13]